MSAEPMPGTAASGDEPRREKKGVSTGCALAIIGGFFASAIVLGFVVYDAKSNAMYPKAEMKGLEIAIKGYKTEYLSLPSSGPTPPGDNVPFETTERSGIALLDVILAKDNRRNPREIRFWEPPPRRRDGSGYAPETGLVDSWGKHGYRIILDYDGDGWIANPVTGYDDGEPDALKFDVIIYSAGADRDFSTWRDNVCSWK